MQETIENLWEKKDGINFIENTEARNTVLEVLDSLDIKNLRLYGVSRGQIESLVFLGIMQIFSLS